MGECDHNWVQVNPRQKRCTKCDVRAVKPAPTPRCSEPGCTQPGIWLARDGDRPVCNEHLETVN